MKIKILDSSVANKIAAGEVVERPASIVKELVENSIDAGATSVTVEIRDGGISLIRIADNGCGMEEDDVKQAFLRHATSKISKAEDLNDLSTLGFRGEALASIAAVSRVRLDTRTPGATTGTQIVLEGGLMTSFDPVGCPEGTGIWVRDLFFNTPVRRKFLKKPVQEGSTVGESVTRLALSNPTVSIRFVNDGKTILHTPGDGQLLSAIRAVFGVTVSRNMIPVYAVRDGVTVTGYAGSRELQKNNRSWQMLFVNGRCIRNQLISAAVADAYEGRLNIGKFPFFVLSLDMPGHFVDVNVHPNKQEVRFADGLPIYAIVRDIVREALTEHQEVPTLFEQPEETLAARETVVEVPRVEASVLPPIEQEEPAKAVASEPVTASHTPATPATKTTTVNENVLKFAQYIAASVPEVKETGFSPLPVSSHVKETAPLQQELPLPEKEETYAVIGQLFETYIVVEAGEEVYLIDQHAAHERLLFEKFNRQAEEDGTISQNLLFPVMINVNNAEQAILEDLLPQLREIGYEVEPVGHNAFAVKATPMVMEEADPGEFITGLLDETASLKQLRSAELKRSRLIQLACKSAIKGGDKLSEEEIRVLMKLIAKESIPLSCPHGRPILVRLTRRELEVRFKRIQ